MGDQPGRLVVQELQRTWRFHAKLHAENRITVPAINKKVTKASDHKIGQLVLIKNHWKRPFDMIYIYNFLVAGIPNKSTVLLTTPDGREKKCNIHHVKLVSSLDLTTLNHSLMQNFLQEHFNDFGTAFSRMEVLVSVFRAAVIKPHIQPLIKDKKTIKYFHII